MPRSSVLPMDSALRMDSAYTPRAMSEAALLQQAVTQDTLGWPWGRCVEACIATLLGVDLDDVPDPRNLCVLDGYELTVAPVPGGGQRSSGGEDRDQCAVRALPARDSVMQSWLGGRGIVMVTGPGSSPPGAEVRASGPPLFWIARGVSPRRGPQGELLGHAVVYSNLTMIWDPHPSRDGLVGPPDAWSLLVPLGLARAAR